LIEWLVMLVVPVFERNTPGGFPSASKFRKNVKSPKSMRRRDG